MGGPKFVSIHLTWLKRVVGKVRGICPVALVAVLAAYRNRAGADALGRRKSSLCAWRHAPQCFHERIADWIVRASVAAIRVIWRRNQLSRLDGSVWHYSVASRPAPFQERATCRASLAADCLLMLSFAGPWSAQSLHERRPRQSLTGRRVVGLALGKTPHLRLLVHSVQLDGTSTLLLLIAFQASAAAMGASGHALAASCSEVKANLKSRGTLSPLAFSQSRSFDSLSVLLMSQCRSRLEPTSLIPYEGHSYGERFSIR